MNLDELREWCVVREAQERPKACDLGRSPSDRAFAYGLATAYGAVADQLKAIERSEQRQNPRRARKDEIE